MIVVEVWRSTGYGMILVLAGLQGIDGTLYEAARIDGAGFWRALRHITLPLLVPTLLVATILLSIRSVNLIDIPLVVTGGGPARMTETLGLYMWKESFSFHHIGYGSAVAIVMLGHQPRPDRAVHPVAVPGAPVGWPGPGAPRGPAPSCTSCSRLFAAYSLFPLLWALVTSLKRPQDTVAYPPRWIPDPLTFQNYVEVLTRTSVPWQILNTMLAASLAAVIVVAASSLAGYGFSRFDFRGKDFLLLSLLGCVMVSGATKVVPLYLMLHKLGLLNSLSGLGLVYSVEFLPISVWLMKSYVDTIPVELDEAASVDGCSRLRTFVRIVFPLSLPGVTAVALITFVRSAQEFIYAATFLTETGVKTSPVGLYMFFTELGVEWGQLTAASLVIVLPIVLVFLLLQKWFVAGLTMGAVK